MASISFTTCGPMSGVHGFLFPRLTAEFPGLETTEFDVLTWLQGSRRLQLEAAARAVAELGPGALRGRGRLLAAIWTSGYFYDRARDEVRRRAEPDRLAFTFQTQSLIDASIDGVPHFVYTDHTAMANSYYPNFKPGDVSASRLARERLIYDHARLIFTMSSHVSRSLVEFYDIPAERIVCVGAGSNIVPVPRRPDAAASGRVLFIGRAWERKGGPQLVAAMRLVREAQPKAKLIVAGSAPDDLPEWVEVLEDVPFERVAELFAETAIFAMPTRKEPFGLVYVEALSCGVPVVASNLGALPDIVQEGETGLLVGPDDIPGLAEAIVCLLENPTRAEAFGELGAARMPARYTWDHVASAMAGAIRDAAFE